MTCSGSMDLNTQHGKMKDDELKSDLNHRSCWGSDGRRQTPSRGRKKTQKTDWTSDDGDVITAGSVRLNQTLFYSPETSLRCEPKQLCWGSGLSQINTFSKPGMLCILGRVHRSVEVTSLHMLPRHVAPTCCPTSTFLLLLLLPSETQLTNNQSERSHRFEFLSGLKEKTKHRKKATSLQTCQLIKSKVNELQTSEVIHPQHEVR